MSQLIHLKGVTLSHLNSETPLSVKEAIVNLFDMIDSAIDEAGGFTESDEIDLAVSALDAALIGEADDEEEGEDTNEDTEEEELLGGLGNTEEDD